MDFTSASLGIDPWTASFRQPDVEHRFRQAFLPEDKRHLTLTVVLANVASAVFALNDLELAAGSGGLFHLLSLRTLFLVLSLGGLAVLWAAVSERVVDWAVLTVSLGCCTLALAVAASRPPGSPSQFVAETVLILALYVLVPNRFLFQVTPALLLTSGVLVLVGTSGSLPGTSVRAVALAVVCANVLGIWFGWRSQIQRRAQFHLLSHERELHAALKEAERTRQTLEGLLPICASCKNIRDDAGYWQKVERYVSDRANVVFSHSICPVCDASLYAEEREEG